MKEPCQLSKIRKQILQQLFLKGFRNIPEPGTGKDTFPHPKTASHVFDSGRLLPAPEKTRLTNHFRRPEKIREQTPATGIELNARKRKVRANQSLSGGMSKSERPVLP